MNLKLIFISVQDRRKWSQALLDELEEVYLGKGSDRGVIGWVPKMLGM